MIYNLQKAFYVIVIFLTLLCTSLTAQPAQIIEDFIPDNRNIIPYMVKQGSDGNIYMTTTSIQGTGTLPYLYRGYCVLNPQGQVLHYNGLFDVDVYEFGSYNNPVFCLDADNTFRIPYIKTIYDSSGYSYIFKWANYNTQTGHTYTEGFHSTTPIFSSLQNVIQLNSNRWIVTGILGGYIKAICVNANGDSLWSFQAENYYGIHNYRKWVKRLADDRILLAYYGPDLFIMKVLDQNGQELWNQIVAGPMPEVYYTFMTDYYTDDRAIVCYQTCSMDTYVKEYYNYSVTDLFSPLIGLIFSPNAYCDQNGLLFTQQHRNTIEKYSIQGNRLWQYTLPDSFETPPDRMQICISMADSLYLIVGNKFLGYDPVEECFTYSPYLLKLPFNLVGNSDEAIPPAESRMSVYPNPFYDNLRISIDSKTPELIETSIYNVKGQLVRKLDIFYSKAGENQITWDGKDTTGKDVVSGMYLINSKIGVKSVTKKCLKVKK